MRALFLGIKTERFRADSASYQKDVVNIVNGHSKYFYIRTMRCAAFEKCVNEIKEWKKIRLGTQEMDVASLNSHCPFGEATPYRLIVSRIKRADKQTDLFSGQAYTYRGILTNDYEWEGEQIVGFYNQRGESERNFDVWIKTGRQWVLKLYTSKDYSPLVT